MFGIVCCTRGEVSVTRCPTLLPPTRHGCKSLPDTPYKEPNEMREKIIRYEPAGRGILSIKDAFYLAGSSSCLLALPRSLRHPPLPLSPLLPPPVIISLLRSSLFWSLPSSSSSLRRHVAATYYLVLLKGYFSLSTARHAPFLHSREER